MPNRFLPLVILALVVTGCGAGTGTQTPVAAPAAANPVTKVAETFTVPTTETVTRLALAPGGQWLYRNNDETLDMIDLTSQKLVRSLTTGSSRGALVSSPDGATVYSIPLFEGDLLAIDADTGKVTDRYPLPDDGAAAAAVSPDGTFLYYPTSVGDNAEPVLATVDLAARSETIAPMLHACTIGELEIVAPQSGDLYLSDTYGIGDCPRGGGVTVMSPQTPDTAVAEIPVKLASPKNRMVNEAGRMAALGSQVYVLSDPAGKYDCSSVCSKGTFYAYPTQVTAIDTATNQTTVQIPITTASALVAAPTSGVVYIAGQGVTVIDAATNAATTTIKMPGDAVPTELAVSADESILVAEISGADGTQIAVLRRG